MPCTTLLVGKNASYEDVYKRQPIMIAVKQVGINTSNARATPGGTCSGILIFNASFLRNML